MVVLSLFDGMSCGQQALERSGHKVDTYYASEIDKYAIKVTMANYPNTIQLGSVVNVDVSQLKPVDLLLGGSPCQSFSFAGKRKGMATKDEQEILTLDRYLELKEQEYEFEGQSYLFWEYMRILTDIRKYNPEVKFLLENVIMGDKWEKTLSKAIGVNPIEINSALLSAQNRRRLYWTNIGMEPAGLFGDPESIIKQPKDKGILLKDILEKNVEQKYFLSDKMLNYFENRAANFNNGKVNIRDENGKATTLTSSSSSCDISDNFIKIDTNLKKSINQEKANCFTAGGNSGGLHSDMTLILDNSDAKIVASRGRNPENPKSREKGIPMEQTLEERNDGKTNCLTSVQKDNLICYNIERKVCVRKYEVDIEKLKLCLKNHKKNSSIKKIAESLNKPKTEVEHWFRNDSSFSIPDASIWFELKLLLKIETDEFDQSITEFEIKDGVFDQSNRVYDADGKNPTLMAAKKDNLVCIGNIYDNGHNSVAGRVYTDEGKSVTLSAEGGGGGAKTGLYLVGNLDTNFESNGRVYSSEGKSKKLNAGSGGGGEGGQRTGIYMHDKLIRRLTPVECERLQTVKDGYTAHVSDTQRYRMLGNGWTVDVIVHILNYLK